MKAAICPRYGPPEVVRIEEVADPVPGDGDILIRTTATTVNSGDARVRASRAPRGMTWGLRLAMGVRRLRNPVLGFDVAGRVEAVGADVEGFAPGDRVVASRGGMGFGAHAEQLVVAQKKGLVAGIPDGLSDQEAVSLVFGASTALLFFRKGGLAEGASVLINGASGAVGTMAVQVARNLGAGTVTGVCSAANAELVRQLGADHVIDYATEDFTAGGTRYDVIMDTHGNTPYRQVKGVLAPDGRYLMVVGDLWQTLAGFGRRAVVSVGPNEAGLNSELYAEILDLAASGKLKPVIGRTLPFTDIVEAHRHVDEGHKVGALVLAFDEMPGS